MSARLIARYADDPRVVTFSVLALIAAAMWLATWQTMGGMMSGSMDMEMDMGGGQMQMDGSSQMQMDGSSQMQMDGSSQTQMDGSGQMQMDGSGQMQMDGSGQMQMDGSGQMQMDSSGQMQMGDAMQQGGSAAVTDSDAESGAMSEAQGMNGAEGTQGMAGIQPMQGSDGMQGMSDMSGMAMDMPGMSMDPTDWSTGTVSVTIAMWVLMMAAMMLPAMAPICAIYAGLACKEDRGVRLAVRIGLFTLGYFLIWAGFSVAAALGQLTLRDSAYFAMGGTLALPTAAGMLLIIAGLYEFTPVKEFCLRHCRHPLTYLMSHWREGVKGAFPVGFNHGIYCLGCCITLMLLMFVFGAMNILWMAVIALYILAEKVIPRVEVWGRAAGALMIVAGAATLIHEVV